MSSLFQRLIANPKQLFLIDGLGALVSAFFLGIVLVQLQPLIGIQLNVLYFLAILPIFLAIYSFSCHYFLKNNHLLFLKGIAIANLLYCCLTLVLVVFYFKSLTVLGLTYFLVEILIVSVIIGFELKASIAGV